MVALWEEMGYNLRKGGMDMSTNAWRKENMAGYSVRFTKASGVPDCIKEASEKMQIAESAYIRQAVIEKLQRDGYLKAGDA